MPARVKYPTLKGKGKQGDGKGTKSKWRPACEDYWKPGGCSQGHNCPRYHPKRQPGRCAICGSTKHSTSQCSRPVKPKSRMLSGTSPPGHMKMTNGMTISGSLRGMKRPRARKVKGKDLSQRGRPRPKGKSAPRSITPRPTQSSTTKGDRSQPIAKPEARSCMTSDFLFAMLTTKSKPTWRHSTWNGIDYMICTVAEPQKKLPVFSGKVVNT